MRTPKTGRPSIFRFKTQRVTGLISRVGKRSLQCHRRRLAVIVGVGVREVSIGDTIEFMARGEKSTRRYLNGPKG